MTRVPRWSNLAAVAALLALVGSAAAGARLDNRLVLSTQAAVLTIEPTGKGSTVISHRPGRDPAWSPDRSVVAIVDSRLRILGLDGSIRELPTIANPSNPAWSPDGKRIAFSMIDSARCNKLRLSQCRHEIHVVNADGSGLRRLTDGRDADNGHYAPTWSPDGRRLAFSAYEGWAAGMPVRLRKESRIMLVSSTDGKPRLLFKLPWPYHADDLDWSRARNSIVFSYMHGSGGSRSNPVIASKIAVINPDGSGLRDLTKFSAGKADDPTWSPDGKRVAFIGHMRNDPMYSWWAYVMTPGAKPQRLVGAQSLDW